MVFCVAWGVEGRWGKERVGGFKDWVVTGGWDSGLVAGLLSVEVQGLGGSVVAVEGSVGAEG